jgi:hypothetical protein
MNIKMLGSAFAIASLIAPAAFAQSSGSFSYGTGNASTGTTGCALVSSNGSISGGQQCSVASTAGINLTCTVDADCLNVYGSNSGATCNDPTGVVGAGTCALPASTGDCIGSAKAGLKTSSGNGNVFVIRPSAVIGLLTDVTISSKQTTASSSALAGVDFKVSVKPLSGQAAPSQTPSAGQWLTYDARFIQISSNLFTAIAGACSTLTNGCFLTFAESTVSAHSFDWVAGSSYNGGTPLSSGQYGVTVDWRPSLAVSGIGQALACVGPVNLTVQQNKIFSFNTVNSF